MEVEKGEIIKLADGRDYVCLSAIKDGDGRKYLYMMATIEPIEFYFVEEMQADGEAIKMRIIGGRDEKHKLFELLKAQVNGKDL